MSRERDRKIPIQVYLRENEKYVLDEKIKESKMRNISEYIRHLILYGYVYDIDYNGLKEYSYQIAALGRNLLQNSAQTVWYSSRTSSSRAPIHPL